MVVRSALLLFILQTAFLVGEEKLPNLETEIPGSDSRISLVMTPVARRITGTDAILVTSTLHLKNNSNEPLSFWVSSDFSAWDDCPSLSAPTDPNSKSSICIRPFQPCKSLREYSLGFKGEAELKLPPIRFLLLTNPQVVQRDNYSVPVLTDLSSPISFRIEGLHCRIDSGIPSSRGDRTVNSPTGVQLQLVAFEEDDSPGKTSTQWSLDPKELISSSMLENPIPPSQARVKIAWGEPKSGLTIGAAMAPESSQLKSQQWHVRLYLRNDSNKSVSLELPHGLIGLQTDCRCSHCTAVSVHSPDERESARFLNQHPIHNWRSVLTRTCEPSPKISILDQAKWIIEIDPSCTGPRVIPMSVTHDSDPSIELTTGNLLQCLE